MNTSEFLKALPAEIRASRRHVEVMEALIDVYRGTGLLPAGSDAPLFDVCPCCESCWGGRGDFRPERHDRAGVSVPWVGQRFFERRVCVVGMNLDGWGGLDAHWAICRSHVEAQEAGHRGKAGRPFAYGAMTLASLIDGSLQGSQPEDWRRPLPQALAPTWASCAFFEAIKCSPGTTRSQPFPEMTANCPPLLLVKELAVLRPRVVLLLGRSQLRDVIRPALKVEYEEARGALERDHFRLGDDEVTLFSCNHPSSRWWTRSLEQLAQSLIERPLATGSGM